MSSLLELACSYRKSAEKRIFKLALVSFYEGFNFFKNTNDFNTKVHGPKAKR